MNVYDRIISRRTIRKFKQIDIPNRHECKTGADRIHKAYFQVMGYVRSRGTVAFSPFFSGS